MGLAHFYPDEGRWWEAPLLFGEELLLSLSELSTEYLIPPSERKTFWGEGEDLEDERLRHPDFRVFERMLRSELSWQDTMEEAFTKIVRVALAAKYRLSANKLEEFTDLIQKLVQHIEQDATLRKRALYLVFLFCQKTLNAVEP